MAKPILAEKDTLDKEKVNEFIWTGAILCERIDVLKEYILSHDALGKRIILSEPFQALLDQKDKWVKLLISNDKEVAA